MDILPIFAEKPVPQENIFWTVSFRHGEDEFSTALENLMDPEYLANYFDQFDYWKIDSFWKGYDDVDLVDLILDEAYAFENYLIDVENGNSATHSPLIEAFASLHNNSFQIRWPLIVKGKAIEFKTPIIRFYGVKLEEGQIIVTGAGIKLTRAYQDSPFLQNEVDKAEMVKKYTQANGIVFLP